MANLTRVQSIDDLFGNMMKRFLVRTMNLPMPGNGDALSIRLDVQESDKDYKVMADIPAVTKDDIKVSVDGMVTISASQFKQKEKKEGEKVIYRERSQGEVSRAFSLSHAVDTTGADTRYENGVLSLNLPKKFASHAKQPTIK